MVRQHGAPTDNQHEGPEDDPRELWTAGVRERLRTALEARRLSHRALAEALGKSAAWYSVKVSKSSLGDWWVLARMAQELGVTPDALLGFAPMPLATRPDPKVSRAERKLAKLEREIRSVRDGLAPSRLKK